METPNIAVYNQLMTIAGVESVGKPNQNVFTTLPALTYTVPLNQVTRDLDNDIASQNIEVIIDIWTETSVGGCDLLVIVESKMRELGYNLDFSGEVPNPTEDVYHTTTRFRLNNV